MSKDGHRCELYLISPDFDDLSWFECLEEALITKKVAVFQLRLKLKDPAFMERAARRAVELCRKYQVCIIINDDPVLAKDVGADGVHLGEESDRFDEARKLLGEESIIGISCYGDIDRALDFASKGANYVAFGAFYPTKTKEPKARPEPGILRWWTENSVIPCVAIGGINADNGSVLVEHGADFIAVVSHVWEHKVSITQAIEELDHMMGR